MGFPPKRKDPGMSVLSCTIGNSIIDGCLLDLGPSINLMPYSVYEKLDLGTLQPSQSTLQLTDRSIRVPGGVVEDVDPTRAYMFNRSLLAHVQSKVLL